jgi:ribosomal protein L19E
MQSTHLCQKCSQGQETYAHADTTIAKQGTIANSNFRHHITKYSIGNAFVKELTETMKEKRGKKEKRETKEKGEKKGKGKREKGKKGSRNTL